MANRPRGAAAGERRKLVTRRDPDALFTARKPRTTPFTAVYVEERIVFVLRDGKKDDDNGVWVATTKEHHGSLRRELPGMRSIAVFGVGVGETGWQVLPLDADDFEESVLRACALVRAGDPRIGKVPKPRKPLPKGRKSKARTAEGVRRRP
jgi:hypothetical protein